MRLMPLSCKSPHFFLSDYLLCNNYELHYQSACSAPFVGKEAHILYERNSTRTGLMGTQGYQFRNARVLIVIPRIHLQYRYLNGITGVQPDCRQTNSLDIHRIM